MENAEEVMHSLEEFSKLKPKDIPRELDDYLGYVAKTGDPVFKWSIIKCLFREKLLNVITDFYESTFSIELPPCPNVDTFNYERMKANLLEKFDSFHGAPFTVQRISELLTNPRKEYNRADKFMRAIEKNILVVSIREPGRYSDIDVDNQTDSSFNGIPEPNESTIETTFTCNDLADADSSSQVYEVVNSDNHEPTYSVNVDSNIVSEIQISAEGDNLKEDGNGSGTSSDDSQEENLIDISSAPVEKNELALCSDNDPESVICSSVTNHSSEKECENDNSNNSSHDSSTNCVVTPISFEENPIENSSICSTDFDKEACIGSTCEENLENTIDDDDKISCVDVESSSQLITISEVTCGENDVDENLSSELPSSSKETVQEEEEHQTEPESEPQQSTSSTVCESVLLQSVEEEDGDTSSSSSAHIDDRTVECDTSNNFDTENNCDLLENNEIEDKTEQENITIENCELDENEVTSCVDSIEEKKEEPEIDDNTRETSVIQTTSTSPDFGEVMEVEECQITASDQTSH